MFCSSLRPIHERLRRLAHSGARASRVRRRIPRQTRDAFGAAVAIRWAGQSLTDLAPYINDARDLKLVLLGGKTGAEVEGHDWEYLLAAMGVSHREHAIALAVQGIGTLLMIIALAWAAVVALSQVNALRSRAEQ